ncbi:hypothetical protein GL213_05030 [Halogeometricum borinquense]|nr:C2H2-type zinc finger protein [Halogeometricum borinquense]QIB75082.1 hypothetical protein G3I44_12800 [Halogeometricum borinquense]QIQ75937.1 hypothetical protein GL213_05030 [Halogeometricum borinquense]
MSQAVDDYECPACEATFTDEDALRDHLYTVGLVY